MHSAGRPLIGAIALVLCTTATAAADRPADHAAAREARLGEWFAATQRMTLARSFLESDFDVPDLTRRLSVYFDVQLRHAFAACDRWFATLADELAPSLAVPDLSVLTTAPVKGLHSSGFGWREDPIDGGGRFHKGADYKADRGTPVYAAGDGVVILAGRKDGYGKAVYIDHGGGLVTRYAHLSHVGAKRGDLVVGDTEIGKSGSTGRTTGPHLHFEVRLDGRAVDPDLALDIGAMQRTQPAELVRLAAMALLPEVQTKKVDAHGPPKKARAGKEKNRPERAGRAKRDLPPS